MTAGPSSRAERGAEPYVLRPPRPGDLGWVVARNGALYAEEYGWDERYEGLGNVIIEALACGTPVVSTDCPFGPREILQDGLCGTLVPPDDAGALAQAISAALEAPVDRRALMRRGLDYSAENAARAFLEATEGL